MNHEDYYETYVELVIDEVAKDVKDIGAYENAIYNWCEDYFDDEMGYLTAAQYCIQRIRRVA